MPWINPPPDVKMAERGRGYVEIIFDEDVWNPDDEENGDDITPALAAINSAIYDKYPNAELDWRDCRTLWIWLSFPIILGGVKIKRVEPSLLSE